MMVPFRQGAKRAAVTLFQRGYNERAEHRPGWPRIVVDGECGPDTMDAALRAGYGLGAMSSTLALARATRTVSVGLQRMVRWPEKRSKAQLDRARVRAKQPETGPEAALEWARRWIGRTEQPPGSNKAGWGLTEWQYALGSWLVGQAWCGVFAGTALKNAGVKGITSRVAAVLLILDDALNGRNGFERAVFRRKTGHGSVADGRPGDLVGLFGETTHVGMIEKRVAGGYQTIEGNTSSGSSGSQSNGGGCFRRTRPDSAVVYIVRPKWGAGA
jgi:hypothetical protein